MGDSCDERVASGIKAAQAKDLETAERTLTSALGCPGPAATRELAGVRLLQRRWPEVTELASTAVAIDPRDEYAWKLLGTSRFVQNDSDGALEAWNRLANHGSISSASTPYAYATSRVSSACWDAQAETF